MPHWVGVLTIRRAPQSRVGWLEWRASVKCAPERDKRYSLSIMLLSAAHVAKVGCSLPTAGGGCDTIERIAYQ